MYGYEILKRLRELFEGVWSPKTGSLYPSLKRLEEHGLIESEDREGVSYYSLTEEGDRWTSQALKELPMDVWIASRWFMRTLREAAGEPSKPSDEERRLRQEQIGEMLRNYIEREHGDPQSKLDHLRLMKERMKAFIEEIQKIESELETKKEERA